MFSIIKICRNKNFLALERITLEESLSQDARIRSSDGELSFDQNISNTDIKLILRGFVFKKDHVTAFINYEHCWAGETGRNSQNPYPYSGFYTGTK